MYINKKEKKKINNKKLYYKKKNEKNKRKIKHSLYMSCFYKKKYLTGQSDILSKDFKKSISLIKKYQKFKINITITIKK